MSRKKNKSRSRNKGRNHGFPNVKAYLLHVENLRNDLLQDGGVCDNCRFIFNKDELTLGHIIPACAGGKYEKNNLRPLCKKCNLEEGPRINEKYFHTYYFIAIFNGRKIKRRSGHRFKSGYNTGVINGIFHSEISNGWCFSTVCGSTIEVNKTLFVD